MRTSLIIVLAAVACAYLAWRPVSRQPQPPAPAEAPAHTPGPAAMPRVVGVDAVAKDPKAHAGRIGIEGIVQDVFADRGAFTMIDCAEFEACGETHCAEFSVPVRVPKAEYQGELPKAEQKVVVIGEVQVETDGYRLIVEEVRREGGTILQRARK